MPLNTLRKFLGGAYTGALSRSTMAGATGRNIAETAYGLAGNALGYAKGMGDYGLGATAGGLAGGVLGGVYGAFADDTSVLGGAMMGAGLGAGLGAGAVGAGRHIGPRLASNAPVNPVPSTLSKGTQTTFGDYMSNPKVNRRVRRNRLAALADKIPGVRGYRGRQAEQMSLF